jgi:GrpB-like predicted nucleotidyltransferase (UPF0157 family)
VLAEPTDEWAEQYTAEDALIRAAWGGVLQGLHHAGSTSVPAWPQSRSSTSCSRCRTPRTRTPPPHWHGHRLLKKELPHFAADRAEGPRVNLHVFPHGCDEVRRMLAFRDRLRRNGGDRQLYEDTKRSLAGRTWDRVQDYADAKSDVVADIMGRALQASNGEGSPAPTRTTSG